MARPRIKIDWEQFDKLCAIQATLREISNWFEVSEDTIERSCKREKKTNFAEYYQQKASKGKVSLRRKMYEMAMGGDKTLCIWLSKQYLGMTEKSETVIAASDVNKTFDENIQKTIDLHLERSGQKRIPA